MDIRCIAYSDGSIARIPAVPTQIWRYMDFGKFASMLANGALYFSVLAAFDDQLEAALPELPEGSNEKDRLLRWRSWTMNRCIYFANCWHSASDESATMWKIYAGRREGIAIRSSIESLSNSFRAAEENDKGQLVKAELVEFIDPDLQAPMPRSLDGDKEVLLKRIWYKSENELRAWFTEPKNWNEPSVVSETGTYNASGMWIDCDLQKLIEEVVLAPAAPAYMLLALREVLKRFDFNPDLVRLSRLNQTVTPPNPTLVMQEWRRSLERPPSAG